MNALSSLFYFLFIRGAIVGAALACFIFILILVLVEISKNEHTRSN